MRKQGTVVSWDDGKGSGFVETPGGKRVFLHVRAFAKGAARPAPGMQVSYVESHDAQGRARAESAKLVKVQTAPGRRFFVLGVWGAAAIASVFLLAVAGLCALGIMPLVILWFYLALSAVTFVFYAVDKTAARNNSPRIAESTLHLLALIGGWPGALLAQQVLRHKSIKQPFRLIFWMTLLLNLAAFIWLASDYGAGLVERLSFWLR